MILSQPWKSANIQHVTHEECDRGLKSSNFYMYKIVRLTLPNFQLCTMHMNVA